MVGAKHSTPPGHPVWVETCQQGMSSYVQRKERRRFLNHGPRKPRVYFACTKVDIIMKKSDLKQFISKN